MVTLFTIVLNKVFLTWCFQERLMHALMKKPFHTVQQPARHNGVAVTVLAALKVLLQPLAAPANA
jgi:hypothetical protein